MWEIGTTSVGERERTSESEREKECVRENECERKRKRDNKCVGGVMNEGDKACDF